MPAKHSRHIALTGPLSEWVESQVTQGEYNSASDLIRTAIRRLRDQTEVQDDRTAALKPPKKAETRA